MGSRNIQSSLTACVADEVTMAVPVNFTGIPVDVKQLDHDCELSVMKVVRIAPYRETRQVQRSKRR